jgi:NAD(P)-dependent dehydrogenase (short-subunit alcohol dehydrogenase family)
MTDVAEAFKNKIAIVTGGGMGLGRALCEELAREGATVVVADIKGDAAAQVVDRITQNGGHARATQIDVSKQEDITNLIDKTATDFGRLDYIFNNAVLVIGGDARDISFAQWERALSVDLLGVVYGPLAAYRIMAKQGYGHIVNVSSASGLVPQPGNTPYCTSKWGVVGFSLSLRFEGADLGVKVSCVCPEPASLPGRPLDPTNARSADQSCPIGRRRGFRRTGATRGRQPRPARRIAADNRHSGRQKAALAIGQRTGAAPRSPRRRRDRWRLTKRPRRPAFRSVD